MNHTELKNSLQLFHDSLRQRRMTQALGALESYLNITKAPWDLHRRLEDLRSQYGLMVDYALRGGSDPERPALYARISSEADAIAEMATRLSDTAEKNTLYFSTLRYENLQTSDSISSLTRDYARLVNKASLVMISGSPSATSALRSQTEQLEKRIFNRIWTAYPLSGADSEALSDILSSTTLPAYFRRLVCSAIMLGALAVADEQRLLLLASPYLSSDPDLAMEALCGLLLVMWKNRDRLEGMRRFAPVAEALEEMPRWNEDVRTVFLQFIRTRDTEKITRSIREDLAPSLMKLRPKTGRPGDPGADSRSIEELLDPEANPEWMDMIENSGLGEKLRKMSEMQRDGADIMLSSFGALKTFPFFNDIANWFLPFHSDHSSVAEIMDMSGTMLTLLLESPALCDSDKYSMVFSISSLPSDKRRMLESQLSAQEELIREHSAQMMFDGGNLTPEQRVNHYVQDLYRFFHLYRRKGEFADPFTAPVNLVGVKYLDKVFSDPDTLAFLADFYFKRGYYSDSALLFARIAEDHVPDATLYQKLGYSLQQTGDIEEALTWYERSELIDSANQWTLRRIAQILKATGRYSEAAEYYRRLDAMKPDDISTLMNLAGCLLSADRPGEALKLYFKVEFLEGETPRKALRPIAWATLVTGDFARSRRYYDRVFESGTALPADTLNRGHLNLLEGKTAQAAADYADYLRMNANDVRRLESDIAADRPLLEKLGADPLLIDITVDKALYR